MGEMRKSMQENRVLLVEDDGAIVDNLTEFLRGEGFRVTAVDGQKKALALLEGESFDLALLDVSLEEGNGYALCAAIKAEQDLPVIFLTASGDEYSVITGLDMGADDYVSKPFALRELLARIAVHLRKVSAPAETLSFGDLHLDETARRVTVCGEEVRLTRTEFAILKFLMDQQGQAVSKSAILDRISFDTPDCTETSLKMHVSNLRKKLREVSGKEYIESVWGIGFRLIV